jgi:hypothetical protein
MPRLIARPGTIIDAAGNRDLMHIKKSGQLSLLTGPAAEKAGKTAINPIAAGADLYILPIRCTFNSKISVQCAPLLCKPCSGRYMRAEPIANQ